jgi:hypothetical protein
VSVVRDVATARMPYPVLATALEPQRRGRTATDFTPSALSSLFVASA